MDLELSEQLVICTGAAGGIGRPTAEHLAAEGARLLLVDRDAEILSQLASELPGEHAFLAGDLRDPGFADRIVSHASKLGPVHGLAHLAAVMVPCAFEDIDLELWDLHQEVNVRAAFLLSRAVARQMVGGRGGRIVLVSSGAWLSGGLPDRLHYAVSKGAITTMVRGLATALGQRGIAVNGVAPGMVETDMMRDGLTPELRLELERRTPLGRFAAPAEISPLIAFLLSPKARFISGSTVVVSGGLVLH